MAHPPHNHPTSEAIAAARRERGWTQQQLADMCGYSQSTISRLERGRQSARDVDVLALIAERLGISPTDVGLAENTAPNTAVNRRHFLGTAAVIGLGAAPAANAPRRPVNPAVVGHLRSLRATLYSPTACTVRTASSGLSTTTSPSSSSSFSPLLLGSCASTSSKRPRNGLSSRVGSTRTSARANSDCGGPTGPWSGRRRQTTLFARLSS